MHARSNVAQLAHIARPLHVLQHAFGAGADAVEVFPESRGNSLTNAAERYGMSSGARAAAARISTTFSR